MSCPNRVSGQDCYPSLNPRHHGNCVWCDQPIVPKPRRSLELEDQLVEHACRRKVEHESPLMHARTRIANYSGEHVLDPMEMRPGFNWDRNGMEEAADGINYCLFGIQSVPAQSEANEYRLEAIEAFAIAWHKLRMADDAGR